VTPFFESTKTKVGFGGQVGYNRQFHSFLAGVEADLHYIGASTTFIPPNMFLSCGPTCAVSATNELTWLATFRGRLGFVLNAAMLIYGTGGLALGRVENRWGYGNIGSPGLAGFSDSQFTVDEVRSGFIYGGGVEFPATRNLLLRVEEMCVDFGASNRSITGTPFSGPATGTFTTNFTNKATIGRAALSWKW
jgi:outer membrane immunogenic protein